MIEPKQKVLFICTHNSTRSQMAEVGIDISKHHSKSVEEFRGKKFDYVVTVCDHAKETCPFFPGRKVIHKGFEDPSKFEGDIGDILKAFRKIRDEIKQWIIEEFCE